MIGFRGVLVARRPYCAITNASASLLSLRLRGPLPGAILSGGLTSPTPMAPEPVLAERLEAWHETSGVAGYWLIGLDAAAALFHHYWLRDPTLRRMLPGRAP